MSTKTVLGAKTPVTELQELCVARKSGHPIYECTGEEFDSTLPNTKIFKTSVTALGRTHTGFGHSKKDSKHDAALRLLKELLEQGDTTMDEDPILCLSVLSDKVTEVRDICVQRNFPLPEFECVRSSGPSHAPEFEYECRIGKIIRHGIHKTKKGAKQAACSEMIKTLQAMPMDDNEMQIQSLNQAAEKSVNENERIFRTYREYIKSDIKKKPGKISDRHRWFEEMEQSKIKAVKNIMMDDHMTQSDMCTLIPKALGLKYEMKLENSNIQSELSQKVYSFELINSEYDCYIFGQGEQFFAAVYNYFKTMLNF
ncbi:uncharacterized protein LOC128732828 [Sabethes cyaneus]|uniref:uncharacterized protein LOC128732828 n=1 Tax=Sabethes cyaneus TaxID=53552 RepID=UPI00221E2BEE|nr:uncharacterized protein LOC128732828 [Sabethes cyaneus]